MLFIFLAGETYSFAIFGIELDYSSIFSSFSSSIYSLQKPLLTAINFGITLLLSYFIYKILSIIEIFLFRKIMIISYLSQSLYLVKSIVPYF